MGEVVYALEGLAARVRALGGTRVLVLAAPSKRFVDRVVSELAELSPVVFAGARVHVPIEVLEAADARLAESGADTIVAVGGGSAIGLGKALRLANDVKLVAIPTTYAGSEMTNLYGTTRGGDKQTGRDDRVRPDLVVYDAALTRDLPIALSVQSLCNALAHVISAASTKTADDAALAAAAKVIRAIEDLLMWPTDARAREHAQRGASACALAADRGKPGAQHGLAHLLGGALDVDHAALHAILLPHFVSYLRERDSATVDALERAIGRADLDAYLHDLLIRAGAPVALASLGATRDTLDAALAKRPELPGDIARDALHGLRPPGRGGRLELGAAPLALHAGATLGDAKRIVVALHGRGAEAGTILRRMREVSGHDASVCVIALRAEAGADRWYAVKYSDPAAGKDVEVERAIARVNTALDAIAARAPGVPIVLAGFSQGACLALEVAARRGRGVAAVVAPCGARIGTGWAPGELRGVHVLIGAASGDKWIARADLDATAAWLVAAGAEVIDTSGPGDKHEITLRQRIAARALVLGTPAPAAATGFGNTHAIEARTGALPPLQNSPRVPPFGLYAEQVNATGFTAPRADNARSWLYRVRPSAQRRAFAPLAHDRLAASFESAPEANLTGFAPLAPPTGEADFVDGLVTLCGAGSPELRRGYAFHRYAANRSMEGRAFYSADGDLLIVPELGSITLATEFGALEVAPGEIALVPRGLVFSVLLAAQARGYVAETFGGRFRLPERGLVGANGLADPRHFRAPTPYFEDRLAPQQRIVAKLGGRLHEATQDHSPFDVVAWHGNLAPYAYNLAAFSPSGNTRFDHGDPSIFTVLTSEVLDFIVFPPRWDATTNTFRPPFFHRNAISEINGIVREHAPDGSAFVPGCCFITPSLTPHGVSRSAVERTRASADDTPVKLGGPSLWFQFESALPPVLAPWAEPLPDWPATWASHPSYFE